MAVAAEQTVLWSHDVLGLHAVADSAGAVRLGASGQDWDRLAPLVEVTVTGHGRTWSGERFIDTTVGGRLAHQGHRTVVDGDLRTTTIRLADPVTGLAAEIALRTSPGAGFLRSQVRLVNEGSAPLRLESVSSLALGGLVDTGGSPAGGPTLHWADNDWLAECRWRQAAFRDQVVSLNRSAHGHEGRGAFERSSQGSWSTGRHLPLAALTDPAGRAWLWQIESSAGWRYETGEREGAAYVALFGPDDAHHQWHETLTPGQEFTTVPAVLVGATGGLDAAFGELTSYRRRTRRPHPDHTALPVIYNDYMNTLMGDPTTDRLMPLIAAAASAGAEVFVVDAGWYDDDAQGWWDAVGAWEASSSRFPGGIQEVLDAIARHGMTPGLWLEPEVVGVRSPLARTLPPEAFFRRGGVRVTEHGRHHLDLRHPAARAHLDQVVDRIVGDWGVGYLKLDYNVNIGAGTENGTESAGAGVA
ncbi:glycoside hydrolase family 36 protein, partial [Streptomyces griseoruber]|uniref:glycoside hydrolase family 36 protein n=1 Tax=Streptomyces griseoruber TaxID=1943 RepID=UPI00099F540D